MATRNNSPRQAAGLSLKGQRHSSPKAKSTKAAARPAAKKPPQKSVKLKAPYTKSEILGYLSEQTGCTKKQMSQTIDCLEQLMGQHIHNGLNFVLSGLFKVKVVRKPATKARQGVNPFTGETMAIKARPARNALKILALKKLKEFL